MAKRTTITNGVRPFRYPFAVLTVLSFADTLQHPESSSSPIIWLVAVVLFILFYLARKIEFDDEHIYRTYGRIEKAIPYTNIVSVIRRPTYVTTSKMWKVAYLDKANKERTFRFLEGTFQHGSTENFIQAVRRVKPSIVVEMHLNLDQPTEQKA